MPIHILSEVLSGIFALETYPVVLAAVFALVFLKQWSAGTDLLGQLDRATSAPEKENDDDKGGTLIKKRRVKARDLHGTVVLVVGGFSSQGLLVCSQLSSLGAQLILLTPTLKSSRILQVIHLLRDGTSNALIYAEQCDITNLSSVEAFAEKWNQGQGSSGEMGGLGAGPAGNMSASTGMGGLGGGNSEGRSGGASPRRIDSIVFMPLESTQYSMGDRRRQTGEGIERSHAEILGRFHLINKLLPTLLLLPPHRDIRIVSLVSPWYAAGLSVFKADDLNFEKVVKGRKGGQGQSRFTPRSPWRIEGAQTLLWLSLTRELQRRIQLMTDADIRPRTKLPGIDDEGHISTSKITNVNIINVCVGFERGRNVLDYLLPSVGEENEKAEWEEEANEKEKAHKVDNKKADPSTELRNLVNPGSKQSLPSSKRTNSATTKTKQALDAQLQQSSFFGGLIRLAQWCTVVILWPLAWLLCKSPKRAAETVTWATVVPIYDGSQSLQETSPSLFAVPGELHREGRLLRPTLPEALLPGEPSSRMWKLEEEQIKAVLSQKA